MSQSTPLSSQQAALVTPAAPSGFRRLVLDTFAGMTRGRLQLELPEGQIITLGAPAGATPGMDQLS